MRQTVTRALRWAAFLGAAAVSRLSLAQSAHTAADTRFMQGMIHHHAQALEMAALVPSRSQRDDMKLLAERIDVSQNDEIASMWTWLAEHHEAVPGIDAHMQHSMADMPGMSRDSTPMMPGMLTLAQMDSLRAATGTTFDRLFLRYMIQHHMGALTMVKDLFAAPGGSGQESTVFRFASDVDTDQRAEIARMQALLATLPNR